MHQDHLQALKKKILEETLNSSNNHTPDNSNILFLILQELKVISHKLDNLNQTVVYTENSSTNISKNEKTKNEKIYIPTIDTSNSKSSIKEDSKTDTIDISSALDIMDNIGN